jgi:hypothetical protein
MAVSLTSELPTILNRQMVEIIVMQIELVSWNSAAFNYDK